MKNIAVFPGSFDPITKGHESVIKMAVPLFHKLYVAIGLNAEKKSFFPLEHRMEWIRQVFREHPTVEVIEYSGLTVDLCKRLGAGYLLRGLRTSADFEFERSIGQTNRKLNPHVETVFFLTAAEYTSLNSSIVRDIVRHGGDASAFVPEAVDLTKFQDNS